MNQGSDGSDGSNSSGNSVVDVFSAFTTRVRTLRMASLTLLLLAFAMAAQAAPWIWDRDSDRIDDRIEAVEARGLAAAFEGGDPAKRLLIAVFQGSPLRYGVYVGYDHHPTEADLAALRGSGVSTRVLKPYRTIDYVRMELTYPEILTVSSLAGVRRVEAIDMVYPVNNNATRASGVRDSRFRRFPTVQENLGFTGKGVVVSVLDTGVNDGADALTGFPGHEAFAGKFVAGGSFYFGDPNLNTPAEQSENPLDRGEGASSVHGTHVAGTALGTGGPTEVFGGVAPSARLVDQKVLSDAGLGFGSADGVEWAILNKDRYGIRVLNLSLGGISASDGTDAGSQAINAAFAAGLVPLVASGNDGQTNYISSPAAADNALTIGATADQNTLPRDDDQVADFSNEGPRTADGDADFADEMKPLVVAGGSGIVSSDGSLLTDGRQYKSLGGTSMSTPHVAGVVALMLEANPSLTPALVTEILKHTSEHRRDWGKTDPASNPFLNGDPNYHPSGGWGQVDAYAAVKEALRLAGDPASQTQVVSIHAAPDAGGAAAIDLTWTSQREINLVGYDLFRAEDVGGTPGVFSRINASTIPGRGQAAIEGVGNRNIYIYRDATGLQAGRIYWYRIQHTSSDPAVGTIAEPALAVALGRPKPVARIQYSITHDDLDNDLLVLIGTGSQAERAKRVFDGKPSPQADSVTTELGEATLGTQRYEFSLDLTSLDQVEAFLPPSEKNPWFLTVKEGGYINRKGRVNSFSITLFDAAGNPTQTYSTGDLVPQETVDGLTTTLWIPDSPDIPSPGQPPAVLEADPGAVSRGATSVPVELFGAEFLPGATVAVSGGGVSVDSVQFQSGSRLTATLSVAANAAPGPRDVTVTNLDGGSGTGKALLTVSGGGGGGTVVTRIDDAGPAVGYGNGWHRKESAAASAGGYHRRAGNGNGPSPTATLVFVGHQVTYFYGVSQGGGSAEVLLDGQKVADVSYAGSASKNEPELGRSITFGGLAEGEHELVVVHRSGVAYVDGFEVVSGEEGGADPRGAETRAVTAAGTGTLAGLGATLTRTVQVGSNDQALSVNVDASGPVTVRLLGPQGTLLATGAELLPGLGISGLDVLKSVISVPGTYTVQVTKPLGGAETVGVSISRTVRVR